MTIRWSLLAVVALLGQDVALAQAPKSLVWNPRLNATAHYAVIGEVPHPGVYADASGQATLQAVIQRAGGLNPRGSPAIRIIRNSRAGQTVYFQPEARTPLFPNDVVVVDVARSPQADAALPATPGDRYIWIALLGLSDRPEVAWVDPEQAQLPNVMKMLGQTPTLERSVRKIFPPREPLPGGGFEPLPSGTVLVFDAALLVTASLPAFPEPQPLTPVAAVPQPPTPAWPISNAQPSSPQRTQVEAQPVPFVVPKVDQLPANPASLPAPGSRFAPPPPVAPPVASRTTDWPAPSAGPPVIVEENTNTVAELVGVTETPAVQPTSAGFNVWQLLGISGTVASLVGVALISRRYLDQPSAAHGELPPAIARRMQSLPPLPARSQWEGRLSADIAADPETDELRELLNGKLIIETEALELPTRLSLQIPSSSRQSEPIFRVDAAETHAPHVILSPGLERQTMFMTDAAADAAPVPAPHFRYRQQRMTAAAAAEPAHVPAIAAGTSIERALSQLQEGLKS